MHKTNRLTVPDVLKGVAVVSMVAVHVLQLFAQDDFMTSRIGKVVLFLGGSPAAPVFMAVMGYFLAASKRSSLKLAKRGLLLFLLGFVLNVALNTNLLIKIYSGELLLNPYYYIFGVDILHLAGLSILFYAAIRLIFKKNIIAYAIVALVIAVFGAYINDLLPVTYTFGDYFTALWGGVFQWSYFSFFPWAAYVLIGVVGFLIAEKYKKTIKRKQAAVYFFLISIIIFLFYLPFASDVFIHLKKYYRHDIFFFIWTVAFIYLWIELWKTVTFSFSETGFIKYLIWLGKNVTGIYVIQWIIIGNIATEIYKTQNLIEASLSFIGVLGISCLIWFYLQKFIAFKKQRG